MKQEPAKLYLDLLKKTLSFSLWPEPPIPITLFNETRSPLKRTGVSLVSRALAARDLALMKQRNVTDHQRDNGQFWPLYADTMIGMKRLDQLQAAIETILADGVEGDFIETGVWRGGACIFMRAVLAAYGNTERRVFVADSFEGLPEPDTQRCPADREAFFHKIPFLAVSREEVEKNFARYGLLDDRVVFLQGWFKDTLPSAPIEKLALLRLDGDMYESTLDALKNLYPKLSPGGYCIIDDFFLGPCRLAVEEYRAAHAIEAEMRVIDTCSAYWRKP
jgi:O-methyltransferase